MDRSMFKKVAHRLTRPVLATAALLTLAACGITVVHLPPSAQPDQGTIIYGQQGSRYDAPPAPFGQDRLERPDPYMARPDYQVVQDNLGRQVVCFSPTVPVASRTETLCLDERTGATSPADMAIANQGGGNGGYVTPLSDPNPPRDAYGRRRPAVIDGEKSCPAGTVVVEVVGPMGRGFHVVHPEIKCRSRGGQFSDPQKFVPY